MTTLGVLPDLAVRVSAKRLMVRYLFNFAAAGSVLLCIATGFIWVRSYRHATLYRFHRVDGVWGVSFRQGSFFIENQSALRLRTMRSEEPEASSLRARASELRGRWQRRPDRFEKSKDGLVEQMVDTEAQAQAAQMQYVTLSIELRREVRRGTFQPSVSHSIHCGMLMIAMLLPPLAWFIWVVGVRMHRIRNRLCLSCGYDLRVSKDRCPECGTPIPVEAKA